MKRNWTDLRDGLKWEVEAIPVQPQMGDGDPFPMIGETSYTLRFSEPVVSFTSVVDAIGTR